MIILAGRSLPKIQPVSDRIGSAHPGVGVVFVALDLSSLDPVREAVVTIYAKGR